MTGASAGSWFELLMLGLFAGFLAGLPGAMLLVPFMTMLLSAKGLPAAYMVYEAATL